MSYPHPAWFQKLFESGPGYTDEGWKLKVGLLLADARLSLSKSISWEHYRAKHSLNVRYQQALDRIDRM